MLKLSYLLVFFLAAAVATAGVGCKRQVPSALLPSPATASVTEDVETTSLAALRNELWARKKASLPRQGPAGKDVQVNALTSLRERTTSITRPSEQGEAFDRVGALIAIRTDARLLNSNATNPALARYSVSDLVARLQFRTTKIIGDDLSAPFPAPEQPADPNYRGLPPSTIELLNQPQARERANAVVGLFRDKDIAMAGGTATLKHRPIQTRFRDICPEQSLFYKQRVCPFGTGFLIAPDLVATAAHNFWEATDTGDADTGLGTHVEHVRFVFGFRRDAGGLPPATVPAEEVYTGTLFKSTGPHDSADWAIVRLDRPVPGTGPFHHSIMPLAPAGHAPNTVYMIGHPCGLPLTFDGPKPVTSTGTSDYFIAALDAFPGNSGSPVIDAQTHDVVGILVESDYGVDFIVPTDRLCNVVMRYVNDGVHGERCTPVSLWSAFTSPPVPR